jgi:hypothetical protein
MAKKKRTGAKKSSAEKKSPSPGSEPSVPSASPGNEKSPPKRKDSHEGPEKPNPDPRSPWNSSSSIVPHDNSWEVLGGLWAKSLYEAFSKSPPDALAVRYFFIFDFISSKFPWKSFCLCFKFVQPKK